VLEEAHLTPHWVLQGMQKFAEEREERLGRLRADLEAVSGGAVLAR
jgi:hypothetical protein